MSHILRTRTEHKTASLADEGNVSIKFMFFSQGPNINFMKIKANKLGNQDNKYCNLATTTLKLSIKGRNYLNLTQRYTQKSLSSLRNNNQVSIQALKILT